jgi:cellulose synthase/poly-beta-1,6-N-acetylglucosamine synthase-like glycosyltransferase
VSIGTISIYILGAISAGIVLVHSVVAVGTVITRVLELRMVRSDRSETPRPTVSVLVPARNEQYALPRLLESFEKQETSDFEIVLVNDRSTDDTASIMEEFRRAHGDRVKVVTVEEAPAGGNPKQNALACGSAVAGGEIILMTDADCTVPPTWVERTVGFFANEQVGVVFGPVFPVDLSRWLRQYQSFDHVFRYFYTAGSAGIGNATGGFGNNLAVRRQALDAVGGFAGLRHSVTEDAELISQVRDQRHWLIRAHTSPRATVHPEPQVTIGALLKQGLRWNTGALFAPDWATRVSFGTVMLFLFASVVLAPVAAVFPPILLLAGGAFVSMMLMGILAGIYAHRPGGYWAMLVPNVLFSMLFYSLVTLLTLMRAQISWKGNTVRR